MAEPGEALPDTKKARQCNREECVPDSGSRFPLEIPEMVGFDEYSWTSPENDYPLREKCTCDIPLGNCARNAVLRPDPIYHAMFRRG